MGCLMMKSLRGDFVIVKVAGKARVVHYIARIGAVGKYEYEGRIYLPE